MPRRPNAELRRKILLSAPLERALREFPERLNAYFTERYYDSGLPEMPRPDDLKLWREVLVGPPLTPQRACLLRWRGTNFESITFVDVSRLLEPLLGELTAVEALRLGLIFGALTALEFDELRAERRYEEVRRLLEHWSKASGKLPDLAKLAPELEPLGFPPGELRAKLAEAEEAQAERDRLTAEIQARVASRQTSDDDWGDALDREFHKLDARVQRRGFRTLKPRERLIHALYLLDAEVTNGGVWQYLFNTAGRYAPECVRALRVVGDEKTAARLERVIAAFPGKRLPPPSQLRRHLAGGSTGVHERFDSAYDALARSPLERLWKHLQTKPARARAGRPSLKAARSRAG